MGIDKNTLIILLLPLNNAYGALFIFFNFSETNHESNQLAATKREKGMFK